VIDLFFWGLEFSLKFDVGIGADESSLGIITNQLFLAQQATENTEEDGGCEHPPCLNLTPRFKLVRVTHLTLQILIQYIYAIMHVSFLTFLMFKELIYDG